MNEKDLADALQSELEAEADRGFKFSFSNLSPQRIFGAILATALLVAFVLWAIAVTADNAKQVQPNTLGYQVISDSQTQVTFTVKQPSKLTAPAICQVTALDKSFAIVGFREVQLDAGFEAGNAKVVTLNTTGKAVSGLVDSCRLK